MNYIRLPPVPPTISEYTAKVSSFLPRITYDQHIHYERHLKYSKLRHLLLIPLVVWGLIYITFPQIPTDAKLPVSVRAIVTLEKFLFFGFLPHKLMLYISNPVLDLLSAVPYTLHVFNPFLFVIMCLSIPRLRMTALPFLHCLGGLSLLGVFIQYVFPTAPPWYYDKYGTSPADYTMKGDPAGLARLDTLFQSQFYANTFHQSTIVFGAFPSLHVGWATLICLFICSWDGWRKLKIFARFYVCWICFAVVYLQHHYVMDAIAGIMCAWIVKKLVPMPPLSTSMVITTTEVVDQPNIDGVHIDTTTTRTTTMIPLDNLGALPDDHQPAIMIPISTPVNSPYMSPRILRPGLSPRLNRFPRSPAITNHRFPNSPHLAYLSVPMSVSPMVSVSTSTSTHLPTPPSFSLLRTPAMAPPTLDLEIDDKTSLLPGDGKM
eukprot:TRINITY_DN82_c0_g1_i2.p1 TRINITY_DN82_c0_g1~~TRINITY_DN82_c0_g1_i2.p1  ORF type:complete len:460 (-),score=82.24 TRINITY_DN82_c0_g1_i2:142-1440(-)